MPGAGLAVPAVDDAMLEVPGVDDAMPDVPKARPQVLPTARATGAPSPAIPSAYCYCVGWRPCGSYQTMSGTRGATCGHLGLKVLRALAQALGP